MDSVYFIVIDHCYFELLSFHFAILLVEREIQILLAFLQKYEKKEGEVEVRKEFLSCLVVVLVAKPLNYVGKLVICFVCLPVKSRSVFAYFYP